MEGNAAVRAGKEVKASEENCWMRRECRTLSLRPGADKLELLDAHGGLGRRVCWRGAS